MQTYVCTPSSPQTTSPTTKKDMPPEPDPEASLITDFQVVDSNDVMRKHIVHALWAPGQRIATYIHIGTANSGLAQARPELCNLMSYTQSCTVEVVNVPPPYYMCVQFMHQVAKLYTFGWLL